METHQKTWNKRQTEFRELLLSFEQPQKAMAMFMEQHAALHSAEMSGAGAWSYEDEIMHALSEEQARCIPRGEEHSIAWVLWHLARIEDVTMSLLAAGESQLLHVENWLARLQAPFEHTGNAMDVQAVAGLSAALDIATLRAYRMAVGRRTREIAAGLPPQQLKQKVEPARIQRLLDEGCVLDEAHSVVEYWSKRSIAELLLMPPTRHCFIHLNEASRIRQRIQ
jgi:hypothetical protein